MNERHVVAFVWAFMLTPGSLILIRPVRAKVMATHHAKVKAIPSCYYYKWPLKLNEKFYA